MAVHHQIADVAELVRASCTLLGPHLLGLVLPYGTGL